MTKRKNYKKRAKRKVSSTLATIDKIDRLQINNPMGFPRTKKILLKYVELINLGSTSGALTTVNFCANTIYDPYQPVGGHKPFGANEMFTYYNHFMVSSSAIKCTVMNVNTPLMVCGVYLSDDMTFPYSNYMGLSETNRGRQKIITTATAQDKAVVVSSAFRHKSFFRGRPNGDDAFVGSVTADPVEKAHYLIYAQSMDLSSTGQVAMTVEIVYEVLFSEPKDLAQS